MATQLNFPVTPAPANPPGTLLMAAQSLNPATATPPSGVSSSNTFLLPSSPRKGRGNHAGEGYRPRVVRTGGQRPSCLVNASVTYCGNDSIYVFGGFDQYTDEVYNHVLKLDLKTHAWGLVDNYGDIPGVRMGHTATFYQGDKLLIYGGENEHRAYLSDVIIFDIKTAYWRQPNITGPIPRGRARHAAVLHGDKLFVVGGLAGNNNHVLEDICYLDLKTWTWSRTWRFIGRFDHSAWIWDSRMWVFGGLDKDMERGAELFFLDLKENPAFNAGPDFSNSPFSKNIGAARREISDSARSPSVGSSGYAANTSSIHVGSSANALVNPPSAPGAISSVRFVSGPSLPPQFCGTHFHAYSSGSMLDFATPSQTIRNSECCLASLDLETLTWHKLAEGTEFFNDQFRWHYCTLNEDGTKAWLLGCATDNVNENGAEIEEYLSDVAHVDLKKFGLLGNKIVSESRSRPKGHPASDRHTDSHLSALGVDLSSLFQSSADSDFIITAMSDEDMPLDAPSDDDSLSTENFHVTPTSTSPPIHVHKLILQARWPHFSRLYASQMLEFHTKKMHIPEPYTVVRAFVFYLYADSIESHGPHGPGIADVAGMLVMANLYDMPRLRLLCVNRLGKELDVDHAAVIWERASTAQEDWLRRRAARFIQTHWGYVSRTDGFKRLSRISLLELCTSSDADARLVGGEELEAVGGLGGGRLRAREEGLITRIFEEGAHDGMTDDHTDADESERSDEEMDVG
ncbi:MAG: hypothetical protein M1814_005401 [Vezdaea aestivalis]|nr:MAG: hypothetical protein M1814_005401 [Vezdaea aestivalis]